VRASTVHSRDSSNNFKGIGTCSHRYLRTNTADRTILRRASEEDVQVEEVASVEVGGAQDIYLPVPQRDEMSEEAGIRVKASLLISAQAVNYTWAVAVANNC